MNLSEMRSYVRRVLNEEGESQGFYSDTELNVNINNAYKELVNIFPLPQLLFELFTKYDLAITNGTDNYALPSDFSHLVVLRNGNISYDILNVNLYSSFYSNRNFEHTIYTPSCYEMGGYLYIKPTPTSNATATMIYVKLPDELVEDDDEPVINEKYHELICLGACERAKIKDNEFDEAKYHYGMMMEKINSMLGIKQEK